LKEEIELHKKYTQSLSQSLVKTAQTNNSTQQDIRKLQQQLDALLTANQRLQQRVSLLEQAKNSGGNPSGLPGF
jgi:septal ring factor EnvC (AmiA/AmiB activator)